MTPREQSKALQLLALSLVQLTHLSRLIVDGDEAKTVQKLIKMIDAFVGLKEGG